MRALRRRDPAPSKLLFRLKRLWRSRAFRRLATVWMPLAMMVAGIGWVISQTDLRAEVETRITVLMDDVADRPEFAVRRVAVNGGTAAVAAEVRAYLAPHIGASSLRIDATSLRDQIAALGWVETARVRLAAPETLEATITLRHPVAVWRSGPTLSLLDETGTVITEIAARADHADLPLVAGKGADQPAALAEALQIFAAATRTAPRLRGLVRVGQRRWDAIIQNGPRILLPATGAVDAMGYFAALDAGENLLAKDLTQIDLRLKGRPTLRLGPDAEEELKTLRARAPAEEDA